MNTDLVVQSKDNAFSCLNESAQWIDAKVRPPEIGFIVKRWKTVDGRWAFWAGFFGGDPKMASCHQWIKLPD